MTRFLMDFFFKFFLLVAHWEKKKKLETRKKVKQRMLTKTLTSIYVIYIFTIIFFYVNICYIKRLFQ